MRPVPLIAAVAAALGSAPAFAAPPTTPSNLRVDVYSGTAAELFWSRSSDPDGAVSRYEIRRDGQLVETRDGLSYFTDSLTEGRAFAFTVTAVDFDGERSAPASVSVVGGDRDGSVGAGGGRPPPPANLTSAVYSSSAAEVFWDRSDQPGLSYEVSVDGGQVVTTDGTSAFLSGLGGARGRGVDVVAIDANGQRSGAANVTLGGGGSGGSNPNPPTGGGGGGGSNVPAPSSLRAELYSGSAGEVFWDRVPGANLSYEVRLDGETVATTNGTSYFVGNRPGLDGTSVEVVAIGPDGARSDVSNATLGSGGGGGTNPPTGGGGGGADAPDAPSNLRGEVYSGSAGEVFWDRVSGTDLSYEVSLDGEVVTRTNGTSYFVGNRPGLDGTQVEVVAIGPDGARSDASSVTLGSGGGSSNPDPAPGTDAPPAPMNARLEIYSGTAAELFFDRAPASANVVETEIVRDGDVLGTTNGTSFFDPTRTPGQGYAYELVAVAADGTRSEPARVGDGGSGEDGGSSSDISLNADATVTRTELPDQPPARDDVVAVGDFDGDGADDVAVADRLVLGDDDGLGAAGELRFVIDGEGGQVDVRDAADVDGDGLTDLLVAAPLEDPSLTGAGSFFVVYGRSDRLDGPVELGELSPADGFRVTGFAPRQFLSPVALGDVDSDGFEDVGLVSQGSSATTREAAAFRILYGAPRSGRSVVESSSVGVAPNPGTRIIVPASGGSIGPAFALGDINGDGADDIALDVETDGSNETELAALLGSDDRIAGTERLADPLGEEIVLATSDEAESVETIRSVGDLNLDGFDDFAVEPVAGSGASPTLVFGGPVIDPSLLTNDALSVNLRNGIEPDLDVLDFDGDGTPELLVAVDGRAYIVPYGEIAGRTSISVESLDDANPVATVSYPGNGGGSVFYDAVFSVGDVDGDGRDDLGFLESRRSGDSDDNSLVILYGRSGS